MFWLFVCCVGGSGVLDLIVLYLRERVLLFVVVIACLVVVCLCVVGL